MERLQGKKEAVLQAIARDRALLADVTQQEFVAQAGSDACAARLKETRAVHRKTTRLYNATMRQLNQMRELMKSVNIDVSSYSLDNALMLKHGRKSTRQKTGRVLQHSSSQSLGRLAKADLLVMQAVDNSASTNDMRFSRFASRSSGQQQQTTTRMGKRSSRMGTGVGKSMGGRPRRGKPKDLNWTV